MNKKVKGIMLIVLLSMFVLPAHSQVTIGTLSPPLKGALLDLKQQNEAAGGENSKDGFIYPRVALSNVNELYPMLTGSESGYAASKPSYTGLTVDNVTVNNDFQKGLYVWDGSQWNQVLTDKSIRLIDGSQAAGKVLTSDANGTGTWQTPAVNMISGVVTSGQNLQVSLGTLAATANSSPKYTTWGSSRVTMLPGCSITLPPGMWRIEVSIPLLVNSIVSAGEWIEFLAVLSPNASLTDYTVGPITMGAPIPIITGPITTSLLTRGAAYGYATIPASAGTQTYYLGLGQINTSSNSANGFANAAIYALAGTRNGYIRATSTIISTQ
jgi:hypothetical protein